MSILNKLENVCLSLGKNNKPTYVVMAIATAKGIFRPMFTMMDKKENPETKKYTAIREGLTEVIAIPSYLFCGELAAKLADKVCGEKLGKGWKKQAIGDEVVAFKELKNHDFIKPVNNAEYALNYDDGQKYLLKVLPNDTKELKIADKSVEKVIKIGDKKFLLHKLNKSEKVVENTIDNVFSIDNMVVGFKRLKENAALHNANKNLMFVGVCTAALFVIPALCSVAIKPLMGFIQKPPKNDANKLDIQSKQPEMAIYNDMLKNNNTFKAFSSFSNRPQAGMKVGGV